MARYREKSPDDLAWNRTRRRITMELDARIRDRREIILNTLLTAAFDRYVKALEKGETIVLEDAASGWMEELLTRELGPLVEDPVAVLGIDDGDLADG